MTTSPAALPTMRRAADTVLEACVLVAVVALPLYFSVLTQTGYEPDKAVLLRSLALVILGAWFAGYLGARGPGGIAAGRAIIGLGVLLLVIYGVATAFSIDPGLSLYGSVTRSQGLWTWAAYLVILVAVATRLRGEGQIVRLIDVLLIGSLPVVVYAYLQQMGYDPVPSSGDPTTLYWPVRSSLGQHIFFASYLVMVMPLTATRLLASWRDRADVPPPLRPAALAVTALVAILVSYFLLIGMGVSHPAIFALLPALLAAISALGVVTVGLMARRDMGRFRFGWYAVLLTLQVVSLAFSGARGAWLAALASIPVFGLLVAYRAGRRKLAVQILIVSAILGVALLLLNIPNGPLQPLRTVSGLSRVANITESGGAGGSAQGRLLIWQGVGTLMSQNPPIGSTWGGPLRDVVGYGPEGMHWAFQAVFPLRLRQVTSEIWTWDRAHDVYLDRLVDTGFPGLLVFLLLVAAALWRAFRCVRILPWPQAWIAIALCAAIAGHLVDGLFSLETAVSLGFLWLFFGLIAGLPWEEADETPSRVVAIPLYGLGGYALVLLLVAAVLSLARAQAHPMLLAGVWIVGVLTGIAVVVLVIQPELLAIRPRWTGGWAPAGVGLLLVALGLATQTAYVGAAVAERQGLDSLSAGLTVEAVSYLQESTRLAPWAPQYFTELAGSYLSLGAGHLDSTDPSYVPRAGDISTVDASRAAGFSRDQVAALSGFALRQAANLSPLDPDVYNNLGNLDLQRNRPQRALREFEHAEALSRTNPRYIDQEALAYLQMGQIQHALDAARAAKALDGGFWFSHYTLALVAHKMNDSVLARAEAAQALYWQKNFWPPPPESQLADMRAIQQSG